MPRGAAAAGEEALRMAAEDVTDLQIRYLLVRAYESARAKTDSPLSKRRLFGPPRQKRGDKSPGPPRLPPRANA